MSVAVNTTNGVPFELWLPATQASLLIGVSANASVLMVLVVFALLPARQRTPQLWLAFFTTVCDLGLGVGESLGWPPDGTVHCIVQATLELYFPIASLLWTLCLSITLFRGVVRHEPLTRRTFVVYHIVCWTLPVLWAGLPHITNSVGGATGTCWIKETPDGFLWQLGFFFPAVWSMVLVMVVLTGVSLAAAVRTRRAVGGSTRSRLPASFLRLAAYPVVYALCNVFNTANRVYCATYDCTDPALHTTATALAVLDKLAVSVGVWNSIIFVTSPAVRQFVWGRCCRACHPQAAALQYDLEGDATRGSRLRSPRSPRRKQGAVRPPSTSTDSSMTATDALRPVSQRDSWMPLDGVASASASVDRNTSLRTRLLTGERRGRIVVDDVDNVDALAVVYPTRVADASNGSGDHSNDDRGAA